MDLKRKLNVPYLEQVMALILKIDFTWIKLIAMIAIIVTITIAFVLISESTVTTAFSFTIKDLPGFIVVTIAFTIITTAVIAIVVISITAIIE